MLRLKAGDPNTLEADDGIDNTDFSFDRSTFSKIVVDGGGGDDTIRIDRSNGVFTDTEITTLLGGDGNDTLTGDIGAETPRRWRGDDVDGRQPGRRHADRGSGNDTIQWDPGDGSDVVDGGPASIGWRSTGRTPTSCSTCRPTAAGCGSPATSAAITMDLDRVETLDVAMLGGVDALTVHDLTGTDLTTVNPTWLRSAGSTTLRPTRSPSRSASRSASDGTVTTVNGARRAGPSPQRRRTIAST